MRNDYGESKFLPPIFNFIINDFSKLILKLR